MAHELIPGLEGIPIAESGVSFVDGQAGRLEYRGISVEDLAEHATFEETSYLLLFGDLPTQSQFDQFREELVGCRLLKDRVVNLIKSLPKNGHPMAALQAAAAAIGMAHSEERADDPPSQRAASLRLISKLPLVAAAFERMRNGLEPIQPRTDLSHAANFLYCLTGEEPQPAATRVLDVCLILHADHTMNASTFTARVVGSTLADPHAVIGAALGALSGPLHGGANETAMAMFRKMGSVENVQGELDRMIAEKEKIPGFGHRVYKTIDPRAKALKRFAQDLAEQAGEPYFDIATEVERIMAERVGAKGIWPNVDLFSGIVYSALGIPTDCFTSVFAIARVSGWLAHWLEQMQHNRIFRPTQIFTGNHEKPYVPISQR